MANTVKDTIKSRKVAALIGDGFDGSHLEAMKKALAAKGAQLKIVATHGGSIAPDNGAAVPADFTFLTAASVLFDAVYIPGGADSISALAAEPDAIHFVNEAYKHCKAICATGEATETFLSKTFVGDKSEDKAVVTGTKPSAVASIFFQAIAEHRNWDRETARKVPA
jgi:catalase